MGKEKKLAGCGAAVEPACLKAPGFDLRRDPRCEAGAERTLLGGAAPEATRRTPGPWPASRAVPSGMELLPAGLWLPAPAPSSGGGSAQERTPAPRVPALRGDGQRPGWADPGGKWSPATSSRSRPFGGVSGADTLAHGGLPAVTDETCARVCMRAHISL